VWVACLGCAVYAFLYLPLLIVVAYSFNDSRLNAEWDGFTPHWYDVLANDPDMLGAAWNSLMIGAIAAGTSCVLGTPPPSRCTATGRHCWLRWCSRRSRCPRY
jgi:spermidine/putrescine transport system permease protein